MARAGFKKKQPAASLGTLGKLESNLESPPDLRDHS